MSELKVIECEQGTDLWMDARRGILTASQIGKLITPTGKLADNDTSHGLVETLVAERITGRIEYVYANAAMMRGTLDEPYARELYAEQCAPVTEIGFAVREINGHKLGASPDGLIGKTGGLEIKSRAPKAQLRTFLTDAVPTENLPQIHACMLVLDRAWWDYCSYAGSWPLYVKRVFRDASWDQLLANALDKFETDAENMIDRYRATAKDAPIAPFIDHFAEIELKL